MRAAVLLCLLCACSPIQRYALKRCPTTTIVLGDAALAGLGIAIGVLAYNAERYARSATYVGAGMSIAVLANVSECRP